MGFSVKHLLQIRSFSKDTAEELFFSLVYFLHPQIRIQRQRTGSSYVSCVRSIYGIRTHSQALCLIGLDFGTFSELWQMRRLLFHCWFWLLLKLASNLTNWTQMLSILWPVNFSTASNLVNKIYKHILHRLAYSLGQGSLPFCQRKKTHLRAGLILLNWLPVLIGQLWGNRNCFLLLRLHFLSFF